MEGIRRDLRGPDVSTKFLLPLVDVLLGYVATASTKLYLLAARRLQWTKRARAKG